MSHSRITVTVPARVATPRGSIWAAEAAVWLMHKLGAAAHALGEPRSRREAARSAAQLLRLAAEVEPEQPALSAELRGIAMHVSSVEQAQASRPLAGLAMAPAAQGSVA